MAWQARLVALPDLGPEEKGRAIAIIMRMNEADRELAVPQDQVIAAVTIRELLNAAGVSDQRMNMLDVAGVRLEHMESHQPKAKTHSKGVNSKQPADYVFWAEFDGLLTSFRLALQQHPDAQNRQFLRIDTDSPAGAPSEVGIEAPLLERVIKNVNKVAGKLGLTHYFVPRGHGVGIGGSDFFIVRRMDAEQKVRGCGESKGGWQWSFLGSLLYALAHSGGAVDVQPACKQLYGDMVVDRASLGVLSNYDTTVFFSRAEVEEGQLHVSEPYDSRSGNVLAGYLVLLQLAQKREEERILDPSRWTLQPQEVEEAITRRQREMADHYGASRTRGRSSSSSQAAGGAASRGEAAAGSSREEQLSVYSCSTLQLSEVFSCGGSCKLVSAMYLGQAAAVKVFDRARAAKEEMQHELRCYKSLGDLQGHCIPALLAYGYLDWSLDRFIAMSLEGPPLSAIGITPSLAAAAVRALEQLHRQGFAHGDVRLQNFVLGRSRGADAVMVVDLARSSPGASRDACAQEVEELELLLEERLARSSAGKLQGNSMAAAGKLDQSGLSCQNIVFDASLAV